MNIFSSKPKSPLGMTKENYKPIDLNAIYQKVKAKKLAKELEEIEKENATT